MYLSFFIIIIIIYFIVVAMQSKKNWRKVLILDKDQIVVQNDKGQILKSTMLTATSVSFPSSNNVCSWLKIDGSWVVGG